MPKKGKCFLNVRLKDTLFNEKFNRRIYINAEFNLQMQQNSD